MSRPEPDRPPQSDRAGLWLALAGLVVAAALAGTVWVHSHRAALAELDDRAGGVLELAVSALDGHLRRFDRLPGLLAQDRHVRALLDDPRNPDRVMAANVALLATNQQLGSSDLYVMGLDGVTLAHSGFAEPASFVGGDFGFRPYFQDALTRGAGRFYALGTTSGQRGYFFGSPVLQDDQPAGVLVVKIDLDAIEDSWRGQDHQVLVTDPEGVIFMSSRRDWAYAALEPRSEAQRARTRATRRYADADVTAIEWEASRGPADEVLWRVAGTPYVVRSLAMPQAEWTVHVLVPTRPADATAATSAALAALLAGLAGLAAVILWQRRQRLAERLALQAEAQAQLERRVAERTAELAAMNTRLEGEVAERRTAEARLRATQSDLLQAGKLAALGQMSAALSHEFNQPLGAARNYAENAQTLLDRGRLPEARGALDRVLALVDRMAELSRHLRNFARSPNTQLADVPLDEAVEAALEILGWRLRAQGVDLQMDLPAGLVVRAGSVRLSQVLVNILSNAMDATEGRADPTIRMTGHIDGAMAVIAIADNGPGIAAGAAGRIFDPFFSTKGVGKGLGLGLSISYNIVHDFGGALAAANGPGGGAVFTLTLPLAGAVAQAAE